MKILTSRSSFLESRYWKRVYGIEPSISNMPARRQFVAYFHLVGFDCFSIGFHMAVLQPNIEIHVPFGFFRVGWQTV